MCQVGQPAPHFSGTAVVDGRLKEINLSSYSEAKHWVVLLFFPKAWSYVCPTEIKAFSARLEEFLYLRMCAVVFASTDSPDCLRAWTTSDELSGGLGTVHVPLVSDSTHQLSRAYNVLIEDTGVAERALFIIDPKGIVRAISINDSYVGRSVNETIRLLDALMFKDEFGEGCPVDWKKGDEGIDMKKDKVEGFVELKKSFAEWARPKLSRAFSGTSQRSVSAILGGGNGNSNSSGNGSSPDRVAPTSVATNGGGIVSHHLSIPNGRQSPRTPLGSPRSMSHGSGFPFYSLDGHDEDAMLQQRMENMNSALENRQQSRVETPT